MGKHFKAETGSFISGDSSVYPLHLHRHSPRIWLGSDLQNEHLCPRNMLLRAGLILPLNMSDEPRQTCLCPFSAPTWVPRAASISPGLCPVLRLHAVMGRMLLPGLRLCPADPAREFGFPKACWKGNGGGGDTSRLTHTSEPSLHGVGGCTGGRGAAKLLRLRPLRASHPTKKKLNTGRSQNLGAVLLPSGGACFLLHCMRSPEKRESAGRACARSPCVLNCMVAQPREAEITPQCHISSLQQAEPPAW